MGWGRWVLAACAIPGCTADNPAFDAGSGGSESGMGTGSTSAYATEESGAESVGGEDDSSGGIDGFEPCPTVLYAANELGDIFVVDLLTGDKLEEGSLPAGGTWGIATHPADGRVYYFPLDAPGEVHRWDPQTGASEFALQIGPSETDAISDAGFHDSGVLWLLSDEIQDMFRVDLSDPEVPDVQHWGNLDGLLDGGGDLAVQSPNSLIAVDLAGQVHGIDATAPSGPVVQWTMMVPTFDTAVRLTGISRAPGSGFWLSSTSGAFYKGSIDPFAFQFEFSLETVVNDLAPVYRRPAECP